MSFGGRQMIKIVAVAGSKNSGKTTLCRKLMEELVKKGIRTAYIKRTSEEVLSIDGTDSGSVIRDGTEALLWGSDGVRHEAKVPADISPLQIASRYFPDSELLILEGGKKLSLPKIWVKTPGEDVPGYPGIFMIYDRNVIGEGGFTYGSGSEARMAERLARLVRGKTYRSAKVYVGDHPMPLKDFVADFIRGGILGMLSALKGGSDLSVPVRIYLDDSTEDKK
jgi:molybdopterin-guanine dinucleotide biosynthesis protein B